MKYNAFLSYSHAKDSDLAPSLERGLEKFAKPLFKRRALEIFRDANDLSASPDLWGKIEDGLNNSEYFIFLGSRKAAQSRWCRKEVEHWKLNKSIDKFLVVLTDGDLVWDESKNDFDWTKTTALPTNLSGAFNNEPLYVDFREGFTNNQLNLDNPKFKSNVVLLAATMHKKSIGDMVGEATKQHKKLIRIRNSVISVLVIFLTISIFLTFFAFNKKAEADQQTRAAIKSDSIAQEQRRIAIDSSKEAKKQRNIAREQRDIAEEKTKLAKYEQQRARDSAKVAKQQRDAAKSSLLTFRAQTEPNPTQAFLFAKEALKYHKNKVSISKAYEIYNAHNISKSILINGDLFPQDYISFLPNDNSKFITYGELTDTNGYFDQNWDNMGIYFNKNGKSQISIGEKYRLWNINGILLEELTETEALDLLNLEVINFKRPLKESKDYIVSYLTKDKETSKSTLEIYKFGNLQFALELIKPNAEIYKSWITENNKNIVTIWTDGVIRIWDFKTKFLSEYHLTQPTDSFNYLETEVTFSNDNRMMLVSMRGEFVLWNLKRKSVQNSVLLEDSISCVKFLNNSTVAIESNGLNYTWNINSDAVEISDAFFECDNNYNNNDYFICGDFSQMICQKVDTDIEEEMILAVAFPAREILGFKLFPSKEYILVNGDGLNGLQIFKNPSFNRKLFKFYDPIKTINISFSGPTSFEIPESEKFILMWGRNYDSEQHEFKLIDINEGEVQFSYPNHIIENGDKFSFMRFSPNEEKILIVYDNMLTIWNRPQTLDEFLRSGFTNDLKVVEKSREIHFVTY